MNPIQQRTDISITAIFHALQKPHSSSSQHCKARIQAASTKELDYTFRKLNHYLKRNQVDWPKRRLLACLDYLLEHLTKLQDVINLPSLTQCIGWTLETLHDTASMGDDHQRQTMQIALKICAKILERTKSYPNTNLLALFRDHVTVLFQWSLNTEEEAVCIYAQRALLAHMPFFTPLLLSHQPNVYESLVSKLTCIPTLLYSLSLRPPVTDLPEKRHQLEQTIMYARLLECIDKYDDTTTDRSHPPLIGIWEAVAKAYANQLDYKNNAMLLYGLTSVIQRHTTAVPAATLLCLIDVLMRHWVRDVCCSMHPPIHDPAILDKEKSILKKLLRITFTLPLPADSFGTHFTNHLLLDTVNFFLCFVGHPVSPEEALTIGTDHCINPNMCIDVDERGVNDLLPHHDLLNLVLDVLMQTVQRTDVTPLAGRIAWCIKSCPPLPRLAKMSIYFLHFDPAIEVFATSSAGHLWTPTIEQARRGLEGGDVGKCKRALVALERASRHPRACERLVESGVLQLVKREYFEGREVVLYALLTQFLASLLHRTAFVRTRLRDEVGLFPIVTGLLGRAVEEGWDRVVVGCLSVMMTFRYDRMSMKMWLQEGEVLPLVVKVLVDTRSVERQMLASDLLEQFAALPLCGKQILMMEEGTLERVAQVLASLVEGMEEEVAMLDDQGKMPKDEEDKDDDHEEHGSESHMNEQQQQQEEPHEEKTVDKTNQKHLICAENLLRSLVKILTCHDNLQFIILSDAFTKVFKPLFSPKLRRWRRRISMDLYEKKMADFQALYDFTDNTEDAMKLHELTAVAMGYAALGTPTALGLDDMSTSPFGMLCEMLVFKLDETSEEDQVTPFRRYAAAQVIEALGLESIQQDVMIEEEWNEIHDSDHLSTEEQVRFKADDSEQYVTGNRAILRWQSPIFEAMLGTTFVESTLEVIPIHDVTFHNLALFIRVIHQVFENNKKVDIIHPDTSWVQVIRLLQMADRFDTIHVKKVCEYWIMQQIQTLHEDGKKGRVVEGLISLYRICRDPLEPQGGIVSDTWPFATILHAALKAIVLSMRVASKTETFIEMVRESNQEELQMFCDGIAFLLNDNHRSL